MKYLFPVGSTSLIFPVFIQDAAVTTGAGKASLDQTSAIIGGYVRMGGTGVALAVDEDVTTEGTYQAPSTVAHVRIGTPANMLSGTYELHFHNDLFATGARAVSITLGVAGIAPITIEVELTVLDVMAAMRGTDNAALATALATAQNDLDLLTGADGATLATAQALYAPSKAGDAMALTSGERTTLTAVIWNALTSGMSTVGSIGKKLADWTIHSAADVWAAATRRLSDGTNIVLAKGVGLTGLNDVSAADVTGAVPTAIQNADALLDRADAIEVGATPRKALRAVAAVAAGDVAGGPTTPAYKGLGVATVRVTGSAVDDDGNRASTLNL